MEHRGNMWSTGESGAQGKEDEHRREDEHTGRMSTEEVG